MALKQVKLTDIARELNVSAGLVSLVLSGKAKDNRISDTVARKVLDKAREMGYQTNQLARGLRTGKSGIIGLIVADIANPFFGEMARFIENEASKIGYHVMFGSSDEDPDKLGELIKVFLSRQVDAIVVVPVKDCEEHLRELLDQALPVVFIDRYYEGVDADVICADNYDGGYQLTDLLLKKGRRNIAAFTLDRQITNNIGRIEGYKAALGDYGIKEVEERIFTIGYEDLELKLKPVLKGLMNNKCEGIFFANNSIAIRSLQLFKEMEVVVPQDIAIGSFDNPEAFQVSSPGITCYQQPMELICIKTLDLISKRLNGNVEKSPTVKMYKGEMIHRESI